MKYKDPLKEQLKKLLTLVEESWGLWCPELHASTGGMSLGSAPPLW